MKKKINRLFDVVEELNKDLIKCNCENLLTGWDKFCSQCGTSRKIIENKLKYVSVCVDVPREDKEAFLLEMEERNLNYLDLD